MYRHVGPRFEHCCSQTLPMAFWSFPTSFLSPMIFIFLYTTALKRGNLWVVRFTSVNILTCCIFSCADKTERNVSCKRSACCSNTICELVFFIPTQACVNLFWGCFANSSICCCNIVNGSSSYSCASFWEFAKGWFEGVEELIVFCPSSPNVSAFFFHTLLIDFQRLLTDWGAGSMWLSTSRSLRFSSHAADHRWL